MTETREVQATVATFDGVDRSGTALLDDGIQVAFSGSALVANVRTLRLGQRVRMIIDRSGPDWVITSITLSTLPLPLSRD